MLQEFVDNVIAVTKESVKTVTYESLNNIARFINGISALLLTLLPGKGNILEGISGWELKPALRGPRLPRWMESGVSSFNEFIHELSVDSDSESVADSIPGDDDNEDFVCPPSPLSQSSRLSHASSFGRRDRRMRRHIRYAVSWILWPFRFFLSLLFILFNAIKYRIVRTPSSAKSTESPRLSKTGPAKRSFHIRDQFLQRTTDRRRGVFEDLHLAIEIFIESVFDIVHQGAHYVLSPSEVWNKLFSWIHGSGRESSPVVDVPTANIGSDNPVPTETKTVYRHSLNTDARTCEDVITELGHCFVLSAMPIYVLIAINAPKWFIKAIEKLRRGFVWQGRKQANGGACLVSWEKVCLPLEYGGLGILNLEIMAWSLQIRCLWAMKTDSNKPWRGLDIPIHNNAKALFSIAIETQVGSGTNTVFWNDKWLFGCTISELAPKVMASVPAKTRCTRTVAEALLDHSWPRDIEGGLSMIGLFEYFQLWDIIHEVALHTNEDNHVWVFDASGKYSSKSAYKAFLNGKVVFEPWRRLWKSWAPAKCKVFIWLAIRNRCWTADRLARRGLPHPSKCPLCDQCDEDVQHLLTTCVFAREFWFKIFEQWGLQRCVPDQDESAFASWWRRAVKKVQKEQRKGLNSLIILGAWMLWKHRNLCVFEGASPSINNILRAFEDEHHLWCLVGARGLRALELGRVLEPG